MDAPVEPSQPFPSGESLAFCLRLRPGCEDEYRRRHDTLWPEMRQALLEAGVLHYEIYLEPHASLLFAFMVRKSDHRMDRLPEQLVWQRWRDYMSDILVQEAGQPIRIDLQPMFRLRTG